MNIPKFAGAIQTSVGAQQNTSTSNNFSQMRKQVAQGVQNSPTLQAHSKGDSFASQYFNSFS